MSVTPWLEFGTALGIGLLIGLERERSKGVGSGRRPAGIRTFTLASLLGAMAMQIGGVPLLAVVTAGVGVLAAISSVRGDREDPGLTTEIGLIATPLIGGLAISDSSLAGGLGAAVAVIFAAKAPLHGFATRILTSGELADGLVFAVATLIIWPQLPDRYFGPFQAVNPHSTWSLVILVMALGACGHVATRALGARFGLPIAGLASGFVSSTATVGAMGGRVSRDPARLQAAVAGASFSSVATFVQLALLLATVNRSTLLLLAPALAVGAITSALYGLTFAFQSPAAQTDAPVEQGRAFNIGAAFGLAGIMAAMLVVAAALRHWLGEAGITIGGIVAGFVDTHSAAVSVASLVASGAMAANDAVVPILAAMTSNAAAKIMMAFGTGPRAYALRIMPGLVVPIAAVWAVAIATMRG